MLFGKKICTATMTGAKIHATVADKLEVEGSLGGLQVQSHFDVVYGLNDK